MPNRDIGKEILNGIREIKKYKKRRNTSSFLRVFTLKYPLKLDIIRNKTKLLQMPLDEVETINTGLNTVNKRTQVHKKTEK